jgi:hypothetical protein
MFSAGSKWDEYTATPGQVRADSLGMLLMFVTPVVVPLIGVELALRSRRVIPTVVFGAVLALTMVVAIYTRATPQDLIDGIRQLITGDRPPRQAP